MNFLIRSSCLWLGLSLLLQACSPAYYPPKINAPLLSGAGTGTLDGAVNLSSVNLQGSYSPVDHLVISSGLNFFVAGEGSISGESATSIGTQLDVLTGWYTSLGTAGVVEIQGGYGFSAVNADDYEGTYSRIILQSTIGVGGPRGVAGLCFRTVRPILHMQTEGDFGGRFFMEPALLFRGGSPELQFEAQFGYSAIKDVPFTLEAWPWIASVGLHFRLGNSAP